MASIGSVQLQCPNPKCGARLLVGVAIHQLKNYAQQGDSLTETQACGTREIHNHKVALASESTRGWWSNRGGWNIHHPSSTTSPKWPQKQGPHGGDEHLSFP